MQSLAFTHLNLCDGKLDSELQEYVTLLVDLKARGEGVEGAISQIGPSSEIEIPSDTRVVDLSGRYAIPGLINAHCHLFGDGRPRALLSAPESVLVFLVKLMNSRLGRGYVKASMRTNAQTALNAGLTTLRSVGDSTTKMPEAGRGRGREVLGAPSAGLG